MKGLFLLTALAAAQEPSAPQLSEPIPKTFENVYGAVESQPHPLVPKPMPLSRDSEAYFAVRTQENCTFPLKVVLVQDSTGSFTDDYEVMRNTQLKLMTDALNASHPGTSFALVSFRDKPVLTLGETFDYCDRVDLPMTPNATFDSLHAAYGKLWSNGGQDPAENQLGALIAALQNPEVGLDAGSSIATTLVVLSTDAWPHFDQDGLNSYGMSPYSGSYDNADPSGQCLKQYYPSPEQVRNVIADTGAYVAFLVFDGNYANGQVVKSWEWFNTYIGQPSEYVEPLANDSTNFWEILSAVIEQMENEECVETTAPPTTTPQTSTATLIPPVTMTETTAPPTTAPQTSTATLIPPVTMTETTAPPTTAPQTSIATATLIPPVTMPTVAPTTAPITAIHTTAPPVTAVPTPVTVAPTTTPLAPTTTPPVTAAPTTTPPVTAAPTTAPPVTVTPVAPTETGHECPCDNCPCPEVLIKLLHKPAQLHLDVSNE